MNMSKYVRLTKGFNDRGKLIKASENVWDHIDSEKDFYQSTYYYNEEHYKQFQNTGTIAGIRDVKTDKLWFDFDSTDLNIAKTDTNELVTRLLKLNIQSEDIQIYFSGNKGFNVIIDLKKEITPKQARSLAVNKLGAGLDSLDTTLYDAVQILRIPATKHQVSGLYKIPLTISEFQTLTIDQIKDKAKNLDNITNEFNWGSVDLPEDYFKEEVIVEKVESDSLDLTQKPRNWKPTKYALLQGYFGPGERQQSMMILAATCKGMGYDKITTYYMCKGALKKSWDRYGQGNFVKEELWDNVLGSIFSDNWRGGQYSETEELFLQKMAEKLDIKEQIHSTTVNINQAFKLYRNHVENIDKLLVKTGIAALDKKLKMTIGRSFGIIAAPGVGKTSLALQMLHNMSKRGEQCIFFSYDMYHADVLEKVIRKHTKEDINIIEQKLKVKDESIVQELDQILAEEYANVEFCFETGQSIDEIYKTIREVEQKTGKKVRFIVIDYGELIVTEIGDPTQSSGFVAQKTREIAQNEQLCVLNLYQPSKMTGAPDNEINSYRAAKGSSAIEQANYALLGISRPGFDPRNPEKDKFISINCVKNRMGSIFALDLYWDGYRGEVRELTPREQSELKAIRDEKNNVGKDDEWT